MRRAPTQKSKLKKKLSKKKERKKGLASNLRLEEAPAEVQACLFCKKKLENVERVLFVEEEVGRVFCSEDCITEYFFSDIKKFEKEYRKIKQSFDLSDENKEAYAHLRWLTLQGPNEVWREKNNAGDYHYTLIAEFQPDHKRVWSICICLLLRGEPSFLFVALLTSDPALVDHYRKGEVVEWDELRSRYGHSPGTSGSNRGPTQIIVPSDGLADDWTEDETIRAELTRERQVGDIPSSEFPLYQSFLQGTLENPDEVWSVKLKKSNSKKLYHFIRYYSDEDPTFWYLIVARETEDEEQIEILDAFPTKDQSLVDRYRRDHQEVGVLDQVATNRVSRVVH